MCCSKIRQFCSSTTLRAHFNAPPRWKKLPGIFTMQAPCVAGSELLWNSTPTFIHRPDGRNLQEPSQCKHLAVTVCELLCGIRPLRLSIAPMGETSRHLHNASTSLFQDVSSCGIRPLRLSIAPMEETSWRVHNAPCHYRE